ncbi:MAG: ZIP family metal transporter [Tenericutes bacterium]|nr:ZIP family metal transporter [Mycoplasmatota bacterium]
MNAILITILSGLSFFIGYLITLFVKNKKKLTVFSVAFSFTVIVGLILFDLSPECFELLSNKWLIVVSILIGILLLKLLDFFLPDHSHDESNKKNHMQHIGLISAIALFLHNIIEGTAIYTTSLANIKLGLIMAIGVSFHNIPLGIQISSLIKNKTEKIIMISLLVLSSIVGVIFINIFKITLNDAVIGVLISVTLGMLIYIAFFELLCEVKENIKKKETLLAFVLGLVVIILTQLI